MKQRMLSVLLIAVLALWAAGGAVAGEEGEGGGSGASTPSRIPGDEAAARSLFDRAQQAYNEQRYVEAARLFQQTYDAWNHPLFLYNKGQSLIRASQWQDALGAFEGHVTAFEDSGLPREQFDPIVYIQIAECLHRLNRRDEATQTLRRYLEASPEGDLAPGVRECIESGEPPSSIGRRDPATVQAARRIHQEAEALHQQGQYRQAAERFLEGYNQYGEVTEFLYNAATSYRMGRIWADATREYRRYVMTACPAPDAFIELAQCLHEQGQYEEAVQAYRRYLQLEPQGTFAEDARQYIQTMTAVLSSRTGEQAPSPETVRRAQQHFASGQEHYAAGRYRQAMTEFSSSYDLVPNLQMTYNIGMCYLRLGEHVRALTNFENVLEGGDTGWAASAHLQAAECEIEVERHGQAQTHIQRYLERADQLELPDEEAGRQMAQSLTQRIQEASGTGGSH